MRNPVTAASLKADITRVTMMKAVAIVLVVMLHVLSSLPGKIFTTASYAPVFIFLDQLGRLSVPVFIGLSGYALTRRYQSDFDLAHFFKRRVVRLVPLYLLWSLLLWGLFLLVPVWYSVEIPLKWWQVVLGGAGDYHLYFVPLVFQLYFLFPVLLWCVKRWGWQSVVAAIGLQTLVIYLMRNQQLGMRFGTDQAQYALVLSWIGYFVFGMAMGLDTWKKRKIWNIYVIDLWLASWIGLALSAVVKIHSGVDPLMALKFTRFLVIPFGLLSIVLALKLPWEKFPLPSLVKKVWVQIGVWSFVIYLAHTLLLRLIFWQRWPALQPTDLMLAAGVLVVGLVASYFLEKNN